MIHPTAIVHPEARLDDSVEIGPYCTVGAHVTLGRGTRLVSHVVIDGWTQLGDENVVHPFAVVGGPPQDLRYEGEPTRVVIGHRNTIRESVTINRGTARDRGVTRIGDDNLFMAYSHVGHDCVVGNHGIVVSYSGLSGHTVLGDHVTVSGQSGVQQHMHVGDHAFIGAQVKVDRHVPPYTIAVGSETCRIRGVNLVGLRRRGLTREAIQAIHDAVELWCRPDVLAEQCIVDVATRHGDVPAVQPLIAFLREHRHGTAR